MHEHQFGYFLWYCLTQNPSIRSFFPTESFSYLCWCISIPTFQHLWAISLQLFTCSSFGSVSMTQRVNAHSCPLTERCAHNQLFTTTGKSDTNLGRNFAVEMDFSRFVHFEGTFAERPEIRFVAFLPRVRWQDRYHSICLFNMRHMTICDKQAALSLA